MREQISGREATVTARDGAAESALTQELEEEFSTDFSTEELQDFVAADLLDVPVDSDFKERLRAELWAMLRKRYAGPAPAPPTTKS